MLGTPHPFGVHAEEAEIFRDGWKQAGALAFKLDAEDVDHVAAWEDVVEAIADLDAEAFDIGGDEGRRAADDDVGAEFLEAVNVAASDA